MSEPAGPVEPRYVVVCMTEWKVSAPGSREAADKTAEEHRAGTGRLVVVVPEPGPLVGAGSR